MHDDQTDGRREAHGFRQPGLGRPWLIRAGNIAPLPFPRQDNGRPGRRA